MGFWAKIEGTKKLQANIRKLGDVPKKYVTAASRKGMNIVLKSARADAPYRTGDLRRGMILIGERTRPASKAKKIYRIVFNRMMNDIFQVPYGVGTKDDYVDKTLYTKGSKQPTRKRVTGYKKIAYYPYSVEYGYVAKHKSSTVVVPGEMFIHRALDGNVGQVKAAIIDTMIAKTDKAIKEAGIK